jgi:hypothetical protein
MNFKGHIIGGTISSSIVAGASIVILKDSSIDISSPYILFFSCLFMSLFPDLDTASIPQRWFYRAMLIFIPYIYYNFDKEFLFVCSVFIVLPLVHKHRGWTHWKTTPIVIGLAILFFYDTNKGLYDVTRDILIINYCFFMLSVVLGHYTHLFLDSKTIKLFKNNKDHY